MKADQKVNDAKTIWSIGHSTRSATEFLAMLAGFNIEFLVDIRSYPSSRRFPHFNKNELQEFLAQHHIAYIHMAELGGRRSPLANSKNTGWRNEGFRGYADYMETE